MLKRNNNSVYKVLALIISLNILIAACDSPTPTPTKVVEPPTPVPTEAVAQLEPISQADLAGATWQWVGGRESPSAPMLITPNPENYTIAFNADGTLNIRADCNTARGTYQLSGDQLSINLAHLPW
jgi:heat shock protein HslJ